MRPRIAWALFAFSLVAFVVDTVITAQWSPLWSEDALAVHGWPLVDVAALGSALMGALIIARYPGHPIGWLLSITGATAQLSMIAESYSIWVVEESGPGPETPAHVAGWLSVVLSAPLTTCALSIMFLLAPDGHLLSRRWRYAAYVSLAGFLSFELGMLTLSPMTYELNPDPGTPAAQRALLTNLLALIGLLLVGLGLLAAVVSMVTRLRRSRGAERQQLRWIVLTAALLAASFVFLLVVQGAFQREQGWVSAMPLFLSYVLLPVSMAIAVLHHRLYDIDLIINRALVLAIGTAFAAVGYVILVVAIGSLVGSTTGGFWPSLLASALVALAFQPLRRRVVRLADRIAYGARAAPYEALADFSRGLGGILEPRLILPAVAEAAGRAVSARRAVVALGPSGAELDSASWPPDAPEGGVDYTLPVQLGADTFGSITVTLPRGRAMRTGEQRLLGHLADQAALGLRNASMDADLQQHLVDLDHRTQTLAESRGRIVEARDAERRRLEAAITRDVTSHLSDLPLQLDSVPDSDDAVLPGRIGGWLARTTEALESLRELTRGVFPTQLARVGLAPALTSYLARQGLAGRLTVDPSMGDRRFDPRTETAAYFCFVEAVGIDDSARGDIAVRNGDLVLQVDGARTAMDVQAMRDRVEAVGGWLSIQSHQESVQLRVWLPTRASAVSSPGG
ncbi:MAG: hypothetical protein ACRDO2_09490 [Nocardioidaceae bacterium]